MDFTGYRKIASTYPISIGMLDPHGAVYESTQST
jgi:hypothetical protein